MLPSLRSITTRPPPRVSIRSPGFRIEPAVRAIGASPVLYSRFRPLTLAARATTGPICPQATPLPSSSTAKTAPSAALGLLMRTYPSGRRPHRRPSVWAVGIVAAVTRYPVAFPRLHFPLPVLPRRPDRALPATGTARSAFEWCGGLTPARRPPCAGSTPSPPAPVADTAAAAPPCSDGLQSAAAPPHPRPPPCAATPLSPAAGSQS